MKFKFYCFKIYGFILIMLISACSSVPNNYEHKFDARLRQLISEKDDNHIINFTMQLTRNYDNEIEKKLESAGVKVLTNLITIVTAEANVGTIKKIAAYDFIKFIEADKEIYPME